MVATVNTACVCWPAIRDVENTASLGTSATGAKTSSNYGRLINCQAMMPVRLPSEAVYNHRLFAVCFNPTNVCSSSSWANSGISSAVGASGKESPACLTQLITVL